MSDGKIESLYDIISIYNDEDPDGNQKIRQTIEEILSKGQKLKKANGDSPLHWTARSNKSLMLETILGANIGDLIDSKDSGGMTPLLAAIKAQAVDCIYLLLKYHADVNIPDSNSKFPTHYAAQWGDSAVLNALLSSSANVDNGSTNGTTALHIGCAYGKTDCVRVLLRAGAKPNVQDDRGNTPLHLAAESGYADVVKLLLSVKADPNIRNKSKKKPDALAKKEGHKQIAAKLKDLEKSQQRAVPIMDAIRESSIPMDKIEAMLKGFDINGTDAQGRGVLHHCIKANNKARLVGMLQKGCDPNTVDHVGQSPLEYSIEMSYDDLTRELLQFKADPNFCMNQSGTTALHTATRKNETHAVRLLLEHALPETLNCTDKDNNTSLHYAVMNRSFEMAKLLLAGGANTRIKNKEGKLPVDIAREKDYPELIELLMKESSIIDDAYKLLQAIGDDDSPMIKNLLRSFDKETLDTAKSLGKLNAMKALLSKQGFVNIEDQDKYELTPICRAAESGHLEIVIELMKAGAKVKFDSPPDMTPLHMAALHSHFHLVRYFLTHTETGLDVNIKTKDDENATPLMLAVKMGEIEMAKLLLAFNADYTNCWKMLEMNGDPQMLQLFKGLQPQDLSSEADEVERNKIILDSKKTEEIKKIVNESPNNIDLSNQDLRTIPDIVLDKDTVCKVLNLSNNALEVLSPNIKRMLYLEALSIANNKIKRFPQALGFCMELRILNISNNKIRSIPVEIGKLIKLEQFIANDNGIQDIPHSLGKLTKLTHLNLARNKFTALPAGIANMNDLQLLDIEGNNGLIYPPKKVCKDGIQAIKSWLSANEKDDPTLNQASGTNRDPNKRMSTLRKFTNTFR